MQKKTKKTHVKQQLCSRYPSKVAAWSTLFSSKSQQQERLMLSLACISGHGVQYVKRHEGLQNYHKINVSEGFKRDSSSIASLLQNSWGDNEPQDWLSLCGVCHISMSGAVIVLDLSANQVCNRNLELASQGLVVQMSWSKSSLLRLKRASWSRSCSRLTQVSLPYLQCKGFTAALGADFARPYMVIQIHKDTTCW